MQGADVLLKFTAEDVNTEKKIDDITKKLEMLEKQGERSLKLMTAATDAFVGSLIKGGIEYNAQMETMNVRLETLTGSAEEANKVMDQIKKDAISTPFDVSSLTQAESLLISTGISAEDSRDGILALGNAISAVGGGNDELQRMSFNLMQIKNAGTANAMDMRQFAMAGINMSGLLADYLGVTVDELEASDRTYENIIGALQKASQQGGKYYGAMEKQSKTLAGQTSNLKESFEVLKGELAQGLFNVLKDLIPKLTDLFNWLGQNKEMIIAIAIPVLTFINVLSGLLIVDKVSTSFLKFFLVLIQHPFMAVIAGIAALVAGFMYLWKHCEEFRNFFIGLWNDIKTTVQSAVIEVVDIYENMFGGAIKAQIDMCIGVFKGLITFLKGVFTGDWKGAWEGISSIFTSIFDGVKNMFKSVINWIIDKFNWFIRQVNKIKFPDWDFLGSLAGKGFNFKELQKLATGTNYVPQDMVAMIHEGEMIVPKKFNPYANGTNFNSIVSSGTGNNIIVNIENNMEMDSLGQLVNNVKTFSGGAKNDYNYGMGR